MNLLPHQQKIVDHIISHNLNDICITLDMGLGKTITALEILKKKNADNILVITKTGLENTILKEIALHNYFKGQIIDPNKYLDTTYLKRVLSDKNTIIIGRSSQTNNIHHTIKTHNIQYDYLILDEISLYKNWNSQRTKTIHQIRKFTNNCIGLTGTPMPRNAENIFALTTLIDKGQLLGNTITQFRLKYHTFSKKINHQVTTYSYNEETVKRIAKHVKHIYINTEDFKENNQKDIKLNLSNIPIDISPSNHSKMNTEMSNFYHKPIATQLIKELQLASGFVIKEIEDKSTKEISLKPQLIHLDKIQFITEFINNIQNNPNKTKKKGIIITYINDFFGKLIKENLSPINDIHIEMFTGKTAQQTRWDNKEIDILIAQQTKIAFGYNLQAGGNTIIHTQIGNDAEIYLQASKRLYRKGQTDDCYIYNIYSKGTKEEKTLSNLIHKINKQKTIQNIFTI